MEKFDVKNAVIRRRSVRTFDGLPLSKAVRKDLLTFAEKLENPFKVNVRFVMLDRSSGDKKENLSTNGIINGTDLFICSAVPKNAPFNLEACGYAFERMVLYAASLGVGTTIIAGTFNRKAFEKAMHLGEAEIMPVMSPLGHEAEKQSIKEKAMRKAVKADMRKGWNEIFFDGDFSVPLRRDKAGIYEDAFTAVNLAPSAVNRQPWLILKQDNVFHFYENHSKGMGSNYDSDIQRTDMGIAACHFILSMNEKGVDCRLEKLEGVQFGPTGSDYSFSIIC